MESDYINLFTHTSTSLSNKA